MRKRCVFLLVLLAAMWLNACGSGPADAGTQAPVEQKPVEITLWCYQVGDWGTPTSVSNLVAGFRKAHPDILVSLEYLDYDTGDEKISQAIASGAAPDLVFESPERLVAGWGGQGLMADLSDLWAEEPSDEIYPSIREACRHSSGAYYIYPVCTSAHCMAINYDLFEAAGALQYLDLESRTWTTEGFVSAVQALRDYGQEQAGVVYCGGQGGDQGTRALVNNLFGGSFTNADHTRYTVASAENIQALELLRSLDGIDFDPELAGAGEIDRFCHGELAMAFCWNCSLEVMHTVKNPDLNFRILPMAFPTSSGTPRLQGGIWGLGVFDNGDEARIAAAKAFIRYVTRGEAYTRAVQMTSFWPVRDWENIYANDALMTEYSIFIPYEGDYYQVTPNWTAARTAWWNMLQKVGRGEDIAEAVAAFDAEANAPLSGGAS